MDMQQKASRNNNDNTHTAVQHTAFKRPSITHQQSYTILGMHATCPRYDDSAVRPLAHEQSPSVEARWRSPGPSCLSSADRGRRSAPTHTTTPRWAARMRGRSCSLCKLSAYFPAALSRGERAAYHAASAHTRPLSPRGIAAPHCSAAATTIAAPLLRARLTAAATCRCWCA